LNSFVGLDGLRLLALQATLAERADPERCDALRRVCCYNELTPSVHLTPLRFRFPRLAYICLTLGTRSWMSHFAGVREVYFPLLSLIALRSPHPRPNRCLGARCAGPMGAICDGQLASPRERAPRTLSFVCSAPPAAAVKLCAAMSQAFERIAGREWCYSQAPIYA
jgi:hypothetical protein